MKKHEMSVEEIITAAVQSASAVARKDIDVKLQAAIELGVKIGAAIGAETGARAAARAIESERSKIRKKEYDRRYQNTKMLLRNYRALNEHFRNAVFEPEQITEQDDTFYDVMALMGSIRDDELYAESIKKSSLRTKIIMTHVNRMLDIYEVMCERSDRDEDKRHFRVLREMYLTGNKGNAAEIAASENIDKRTVYKDIDAATVDITALLFGIDSLRSE
jgi:hypothetical protein